MLLAGEKHTEGEGEGGRYMVIEEGERVCCGGLGLRIEKGAEWEGHQNDERGACEDEDD